MIMLFNEGIDIYQDNLQLWLSQNTTVESRFLPWITIEYLGFLNSLF
jgi:hypothetical protein